MNSDSAPARRAAATVRSIAAHQTLFRVGVAASAWCVACTLGYYIAPGFATLVNLWWFDSPMALFELALGVWLLMKGLSAH